MLDWPTLTGSTIALARAFLFTGFNRLPDRQRRYTGNNHWPER